MDMISGRASRATRARERENHLPFTRARHLATTPAAKRVPTCNFNNTMDGDEDWNAFLKDHPIFTNGKGKRVASAKDDVSLELSLNTLPDFTTDDLDSDALTPSGRRQVMVIKDYDLILAVGNEIRMASLGDAKLGRSGGPEEKTYKVCMSAPTASGAPFSSGLYNVI